MPAPPIANASASTSRSKGVQEQPSQSLHQSMEPPPIKMETRQNVSGASPHSPTSSINLTMGFYPTFRPHSQSVSSSTSSSIGDTATASNKATGRRVNRLSNLDRKDLCEFAARNPRMKHDLVGQLFGVERSTVSKILKNKQKWLGVNIDNTLGSLSEASRRMVKAAKHRAGRHPELEDLLMQWGRQETRKNIRLTDEQVREKALQFADSLHILPSAFKASAGWLENFKERGGFRNGKFSLSSTAAASKLDLLDSDANYDTTLEQDDSTSTSPTWDSLGTSYPPSSSGWMSPLSSMGKPSGSLNSSVVSLPGLVEEEMSDSPLDNPSATNGLQSRPSLALHQRTSSSSYSSDASPHPSPSCDMSSEFPRPPLPAIPHMTPQSQKSMYQLQPENSRTPVRDAYTYPSELQIHQNGLEYDIDLQSLHLQTMEGRRPMEMSISTLNSPTNQPLNAMAGAAYPNGHVLPNHQIHEHGPAYALRPRHPTTPLHLQNVPQPASRLSSAGRVRQSTYPSSQPRRDGPLFSEAPPPHKSPLHRSHTEPMPVPDQQIEHERQQAIRANIVRDHSFMQLDPMPSHEPAPGPGISHSMSLPHQARRATMSNLQDVSSLGVQSNYHAAATVPGLQMSAYGGSPSTGMMFGERTTFDEAFFALRKVVGFLQVRQPPPVNLASSSQMAVLESLLDQFQEAYSSRLPNLTPPRST